MKHRSAQAQVHLTEIRARAVLVSARTALVNAVRGLVKSYGERLRKCDTQQVRWETTSGLSAGLREALKPRKIAAITLLVWKNGVCFDAEYLKPQAA